MLRPTVSIDKISAKFQILVHFSVIAVQFPASAQCFVRLTAAPAVLYTYSNELFRGGDPMKQRIISLFCLVLAAVLLAPAALAGWQPPEEASAPEAAAVYLAELNTGTVLYERNADEPRAIASLTKMMTCLLLAESGADLDEVFLVPQELAEEFWLCSNPTYSISFFPILQPISRDL